VKKKLIKQTGKESPMPQTPQPTIEVEEVLEHISSPYRWELLEVPTVKPAASTSKKSHQ
jgi:hypothetical protein